MILSYLPLSFLLPKTSPETGMNLQTSASKPSSTSTGRGCLTTTYGFHWVKMCSGSPGAKTTICTLRTHYIFMIIYIYMYISRYRLGNMYISRYRLGDLWEIYWFIVHFNKYLSRTAKNPHGVLAKEHARSCMNVPPKLKPPAKTCRKALSPAKAW